MTTRDFNDEMDDLIAREGYSWERERDPFTELESDPWAEDEEGILGGESELWGY